MKVSIFLITVFLVGNTVLSQELAPSDSINLDSSITCLCGSLRDEVYVGLENGSILQLASDGKLIETFSYPNLGKVSQINCANSLKVFAFFEDTQQYLFLDRFTVHPTLYQVDNLDLERADFMEMAVDQSLWSISSPGLSLKRRFGEISTELYLLPSILAADEELLGLYALGNEMVLHTDSRIHFFNLAGQLIQSIANETDELSISQNEAYSIDASSGSMKSLRSNQAYHVGEGVDVGIKLKSTFVLSRERQLFFYRMR